jgi:hypothetical protein
MAGTMTPSSSSRFPEREKLPEFQQFKHLKRQPIGIREAARKYGPDYGVYNELLIRWRNAGWIEQLGRHGKRVLLDEQQVAYCSLIYSRSSGRGKRVFNPDGTPFTPKARNKEP